MRSFIRQSAPFQALLDRVGGYLGKFWIDCRTDVFEHSLLHLIGYQKIPERCKFFPFDDRFFCIDFNAPFTLKDQDFIAELKNALVLHDAKEIQIKEIDPINCYGFVVRLHIPYEFIHLNWGSLESSILHVTSKLCWFYKNWQAIINARPELTNGCDYLCCSVGFIERSVENLRLDFPYLSTEAIWNYLLRYVTGNQDLSITKDITAYVDVDSYPYLTFGDTTESVVMGKDQLLMLLYKVNENRELKEFIAKQINLNQYPSILPEYKQLFLEKSINLFFIRNGLFMIDLSDYLKDSDRKDLFCRYEKFTIGPPKKCKVDGSVYYVFTPENYVKAVLAIKEIEGEACLDERWHELEFLFRAGQWENLEKRFLFLMSLSTVDYASFVFKLYYYAEAIKSEELIKVVKIVGNTVLADQESYTSAVVTKFYSLFLKLSLGERASSDAQRHLTGSSFNFFNVDPNNFNANGNHESLFGLTHS